MIELMIAMSVLIVILIIALWFVSKALFASQDRLQQTETALQMQRKSQTAVNQQIQQEHKDHADNQATISNRDHFGK